MAGALTLSAAEIRAVLDGAHDLLDVPDPEALPVAALALVGTLVAAAVSLAVTATALGAVRSGTYTGTLAPPPTDISITLTVTPAR